MIVLYAALAVKLGRWSITMPMVFVAVGFLLGPSGANLLAISPQTETVKRLTEITLALLLFADASTLKLEDVRDDAGLSGRLLTIGLVLTIAAGAVVALILQPQEGLAFACLLGAILAPTDAALGLPIFNNPRVPVRIRRALNIESGLNDGIATPFVLLFLAYAAATEGQASGAWLSSALIEIALAVLAGVAIGAIGGWLLTQTTRRGWTSGGAEQLAILGLALAAYSWLCGDRRQRLHRRFHRRHCVPSRLAQRFVEPTEFTETFGTFLSLLVWGIFGAILVSTVLEQYDRLAPDPLCHPQPDGRPNGAGGAGAAGRGPAPRHGQPDGLVRPARAGLGGLHVDGPGASSRRSTGRLTR